MPVKSLDRRARMTREILKQSLIELMKNKPIHDISIKKICETADINRSTFYHHYDSQFDLFNDILNDIGYEGNLNFESGAPGPREINQAGYEYLAAIGRYLVSLRENDLG